MSKFFAHSIRFAQILQIIQSHKSINPYLNKSAIISIITTKLSVPSNAVMYLGRSKNLKRWNWFLDIFDFCLKNERRLFTLWTVFPDIPILLEHVLYYKKAIYGIWYILIISTIWQQCEVVDNKISRSVSKTWIKTTAPRFLQARNSFYFLRYEKIRRKYKIVEPHMNAHTIGIEESVRIGIT